MRKVLDAVVKKLHKITSDYLYRRKIEELKKRDPFIYP